MKAADIILSFGFGAGVLFGALITVGIALLLWEKASERIEARALNHGFMLGRRNERRELEIELSQLAWQGDVQAPRESGGEVFQPDGRDGGSWVPKVFQPDQAS